MPTDRSNQESTRHGHEHDGSCAIDGCPGPAMAEAAARKNNERPTPDLVREWRQATQSVASLRGALNSAECAQRNAENALGKRLAPSDMKDGEQIGLWTRLDEATERVIVVTRQDINTFSLKIREGSRHASR